MRSPLGTRKFLLACENRPTGSSGSKRAEKKLHGSAVLLVHSQEAEAKAHQLAELMSPCDCGGTVVAHEVPQEPTDIGSRHGWKKHP